MSREGESDLLSLLTRAKIRLDRPSRDFQNTDWRDIEVPADSSAAGHGDGSDQLDAPALAAEGKKDEWLGVESLVRLLRSRSKAVAHAAVKVLAALSDFLRRSTSLWPSFLLHLWAAAQSWASGQQHLPHKDLQVKFREEDLSGLGEAEEHETQPWKVTESNASFIKGDYFSAASSVLQLLQQILKGCLKSSNERPQDLRTFLELFTVNVVHAVTAICILPPLSTDFGHTVSEATERDVNVQQQLHTRCIEDDNLNLQKELLLGSLLRLLCTGTCKPALTFTPHDDATFHGSYLEMMEKLLPITSNSALSLHRECRGNICVSPFLRHKQLILMMRLSDQFGIKSSLALSCLNALHSYGIDLLEFNLLLATSERDSVEDSPLARSMVCSPSTGEASVSSVSHLQRRALLLLFKVAYSAHQSSEASRSKRGTRDVILPGIGNHQHSTINYEDNPFVNQVLVQWLNRQQEQSASSGTVPEDSSGCGSCAVAGQLAKALVQFYLDEDDLMLEMLLQLLNPPSLPVILMCSGAPNIPKICRSAVMAFTPTRLLHAFLATIQYDSSTLVDFLISDGTSTLFLLYLMRSLRHIANSWPEFVMKAGCACFKNPPVSDICLRECKEVNKCSCLQRCDICFVDPMKTSHGQAKRLCVSRLEGLDHDKSYSTGQISSAGAFISVEDGSDGEQDLQPEGMVDQAAHCLYQLKLSIERLHRRNLFPYDPTPLLRRFETVMELLGDS